MTIAIDSLMRMSRQAGDETKVAAQALEAYFLRQVLAEMRSAGFQEAGSLDGGFAGSTFHEMLDQALADGMANAGGVGLAKMIEADLNRNHGAKAPAQPVETNKEISRMKK